MTAIQDHQLENLIRMANQIVDNVNIGDGDESKKAEQVANHIRRFWARAMKQQMIDYLSRDGRKLSRILELAIHQLDERN